VKPEESVHALRRIAVTRTPREPSQTGYGAEADLQAVAPVQEQWHGDSTLIWGKFGQRQRQNLADHGFHRRPLIGGQKH